MERGTDSIAFARERETGYAVVGHVVPGGGSGCCRRSEISLSASLNSSPNPCLSRPCPCCPYWRSEISLSASLDSSSSPCLSRPCSCRPCWRSEISLSPRIPSSSPCLCCLCLHPPRSCSCCLHDHDHDHDCHDAHGCCSCWGILLSWVAPLPALETFSSRSCLGGRRACCLHGYSCGSGYG